MTTKASARPEQSNDNTQPPAEKRSLGPVTPSTVLSFLFNRVRDFDADELRFLSGAADCASHMAYGLADTVSNIGCLINADFTPGRMRAGNFEIPDNVSSLLFVVADQVRVISELTQIGSDASSMLRHRESSRV
ncbi:hypothetical protein RI103_14060 [Paraburkholderia sp. FT54]|uniref:hypothetical protein n=1 Tax=Paraburkholderia sp. FT54 TaxID=3074437 RepID=UPI002877B975|nr:hypothetical protein [Paraburkholderia sp. FT54]WNC88823.1 hypothetical protein RI103_14060 [Paraburkholderia sp. FT54]